MKSFIYSLTIKVPGIQTQRMGFLSRHALHTLRHAKGRVIERMRVENPEFDDNMNVFLDAKVKIQWIEDVYSDEGLVIEFAELEKVDINTFHCG